MMKRLLFTTVCVVVAAVLLGVWVASRWEVWFGNPVEPPYVSPARPVRLQLTLGDGGASSRTVTWQCGDTVARAEAVCLYEHSSDTLRVPASGCRMVTPGGVTVIYRADFNQLLPGSYHYRVSTADVCSPWHSFRISDGSRPTFVYLGDLQDTLGGTMRQLALHIARTHPQADFWVLGGDVVERPHDCYRAEYFRSMDSIAQAVPFVAAPGNHEYLKGIPLRLEGRFPLTFAHLSEWEERKYAVSQLCYGPVNLITLDSNRDPWLLPRQRRWLKRALETADTARWKVVVIHHPIYSIRGRFHNLLQRWAFNPLLKRHHVDLVLQGHEHNYARAISRGDDSLCSTPVYIVGQASPKDYRLYFNPRYDRFGTGRRFYTTVSACNDTLAVYTYTEEGTLYDALHVIEEKGGKRVDDLSGDIPLQLTPNPNRLRMNGQQHAAYQAEAQKWAARKARP